MRDRDSRHSWTRAALAAATILAAGCGGADENGGAAEPTPEQAATPPLLPYFEEVTGPLGIEFHHDAGLDDSFFMPQIIGAGVALFDCDGDGDLDLYVVNGAPRQPGSGPPPRNRLYRMGEHGRYEDVTEASGVGDTRFGMGVAIGDYDNDGHPDVYLANYGPDALYRNRGDGTFTDVTASIGAVNERWACSAAFVDFDRDGHLDLYVVNYVHHPGLKVCSDDAGRYEFCGPRSSPPSGDVLFHNNGDGTFTDVTETSGIGTVSGRGLGVLCEDFDRDGWTDVYVANDGEANQLWMNDGDGTFTDSAIILGAALNMFAKHEASMGVTGGDIDNDGDVDLFMTHLAKESNTLYRNDGSGSFDDVTAAAGLGAPSIRYTGFGTAFLDLDNDGNLDVAVVNGRVMRGRGEGGAGPLAAYAEPNLLFAGDGRGRFTDVSERGAGFHAEIEVSRGLAVGDIDGDGGQDLVVTNCHGPVRIYRNVVPRRGHWLSVRALDPRLRRDVYGARVTVVAGERSWQRTINPAQSYASSCEPRAHFGLGDLERVDAVEVRWPDGAVDRLEDVAVDQAMTVTRAAPGRQGG